MHNLHSLPLCQVLSSGPVSQSRGYARSSHRLDGYNDPSLCRTPHLDAAFQETLRLTSGASFARTVIAPTTLRCRVLQKDTKLIMPYRQLNFDEAIFGPQVREFRPERILEKDIARNPSFKPFGGGITYCSDRFIAKREVLGFVAVVLSRYDIELKDSNTVLPRLDEKKPTLGVMHP